METDQARRGVVSIDGEEYVPRRLLDELRAERDRLASELERLRQGQARGPEQGESG